MLTVIIVFLGCFLKAYFTWGGDWKTQTILYRKHQDPSRTIEFQMRGDKFAFGYKKRVIERKQIMPYFDLITDVDTTKVDISIWDKVNENVNEFHLSGE